MNDFYYTAVSSLRNSDGHSDSTKRRKFVSIGSSSVHDQCHENNLFCENEGRTVKTSNQYIHFDASIQLHRFEFSCWDCDRQIVLLEEIGESLESTIVSNYGAGRRISIEDKRL